MELGEIYKRGTMGNQSQLTRNDFIMALAGVNGGHTLRRVSGTLVKVRVRVPVIVDGGTIQRRNGVREPGSGW